MWSLRFLLRIQIYTKQQFFCTPKCIAVFIASLLKGHLKNAPSNWPSKRTSISSHLATSFSLLELPPNRIFPTWADQGPNQRDVSCHHSSLFSFWAQLSWRKLHMPGRSLAVHPASVGGAPRVRRYQGSHEQGAKESTKQLEKPPQWSGVSMPSWEVAALPSSNF